MNRLTGRILVDFAKTLKSPGETNCEFAHPRDLSGLGEIDEHLPGESGNFRRAENISGDAGISRLARITGRLLVGFAKTLKSFGGGEF